METVNEQLNRLSAELNDVYLNCLSQLKVVMFQMEELGEKPVPEDFAADEILDRADPVVEEEGKREMERCLRTMCAVCFGWDVAVALRYEFDRVVQRDGTIRMVGRVRAA